MRGSQTSKRMVWHVKETDMDTERDIYSIPPTYHPLQAQNGKRQRGLEDNKGQRQDTEDSDFRSKGLAGRK